MFFKSYVSYVFPNFEFFLQKKCGFWTGFFKVVPETAKNGADRSRNGK